MYDGKHDPDVEENKQRSQTASDLGWKYYDNGDLDTAIKRFNQAWMFNRNNSDAYWGFGLIIGQRSRTEDPESNLRDSVKYLTKSNELSADNSKLIVDLAFSNTILGYYLKTINNKEFKNYFQQAELLYANAEKIENNYPQLYFNWSVLMFYEGRYKEAKLKLNQAKKLGYQDDPGYEKELSDKLNSIANK